MSELAGERDTEETAMLEAAFRDDVIAHPDDDAVRRVFADWLDEQGDPLGEFIRVQCQLAGLPPWDPAREPLERREADLLAEHEEHWLSPLPYDLYRWEFARGFLTALTLRWRASLADAGHLFAGHPVEDVHFVHLGSHLLDLLGTPHLERLRGLHLGHISYPEPHLRALLSSPRLGGLRRLTGLAASGDRDVVPLLADLPFTPRLTELGLGWRAEASLPTVLTAPAFAGLTALSLDATLSEESLTRLVAPGQAQRWTKLSLMGGPTPAGAAAGIDRCVRLRELRWRWPASAPTDSLRLPAGLKALGVWDPEDGGTFLPALSEQDVLDRLDRLEIGVWEPRSLATAADWQALGRVLERLPGPCLYLTFHESIPGALSALARLPGLGRLAGLSVEAEEEPDDEGLWLLLECPELANLRYFRLHYPALTGEQLGLLARSPLLGRLRTLSLFQTRLGDKVVPAFLGEAQMPWLTDLDLGSSGIGARTVAALAQWPGLARLRRLHLWFNEIDAKGIRPLLRAPGLRSLVQLELEQNARRRPQPLQREHVRPLLERLGHRLSI
jgi:uncharacterized protein (TIGR02996 family)